MSAAGGLRVAVVDDDPAVREVVRDRLLQAPGFAPAWVFASGREALAALARNPVDLALVDLHMPGESGVEVIRQLVACRGATSVIAFTADASDGSIREAIAAGARGYLWKEESLGRFVALLQEARLGHAPVSPRPLRFLIGELGPDTDVPQLPQLTRQENRILHLTAKGANCREISANLGINLQTVYKHNKNILRKLSVKSRTQAIEVYQAAVPPAGRPS